MSEVDILTTILKLQGIDYALADLDGRVTETSGGFSRWVDTEFDTVQGQPLRDLFLEFTGLEEDIIEVAQGRLPSLKIEKIARQDCYISLNLAAESGGLILLITDDTQKGTLEQRIIQQRNELILLVNDLARTQAQLDDLLHRFLPYSGAE